MMMKADSTMGGDLTSGKREVFFFVNLKTWEIKTSSPKPFQGDRNEIEVFVSLIYANGRESVWNRKL